MSRPARRRLHRARAQAARISGSFGQSTVMRLQTKSLPTSKCACSLSTSRHNHNNRSVTKVSRLVKIFLSCQQAPAVSSAEPASPTLGNQEAQNKRPAASRPLISSAPLPASPVLSQYLIRSVLGGDRAAPGETVVHADLDGVLIV